MKLITSLDQIPDFLDQVKFDASGKALVPKNVSDYILVLKDADNKVFMLTSIAIKKAGLTNSLSAVYKKIKVDYADSMAKVPLHYIAAEVFKIFKEQNFSEIIKKDNDTSVEEQFTSLMIAAYKLKASDVHFIRTGNLCTIKIRVYGDLRKYAEWGTDDADSVVSVGYNLGESKDAKWDPRLPQRTNIKIVVDSNVTLYLRYEHSASFGQDSYHAVIRVLPSDKREIDKVIPPETLGYTADQAKRMMLAFSKPSGCLIFSGTTGSGKSTSMGNLIKIAHQKGEGREMIITIESPIEQELPAVQTAVMDKSDQKGQENAKNPFAAQVKSCMRRDPDVIMIGEVRDSETADALKHAVQTGHKVISTVHAQSALDIPARLYGEGLGLDVMSSPKFFTALVFQVLVPVLDNESKIRVTSENALEHLDQDLFDALTEVLGDIDNHDIFVRGSRPEFPEGISGMTVCAEVQLLDSTIREHIFKGEFLQAAEYVNEKSKIGAEKNYTGDFSALDHAIFKVSQGLVDPNDLYYKFGMLDPNEVNIKSMLKKTPNVAIMKSVN